MTQDQLTPCTIARAQDIIKRFREIHSSDIRSLDFITSSYLNGDGNRKLRQAVIFCITHEVKPVSKCTLFAVSDALKTTIQQSQIF